MRVRVSHRSISIAMVLLFAASCIAETLSGNPADAMVRIREDQDLKVTNEDKTSLRAGRYDPDNGEPADTDSVNANVVFPFLLPDYGSAATPFSNVTLTVRLNSIGTGTDYGIDLYGLDARSAPNPLTNDFYFALSDDTGTNVTKLQSLIFTTNTTPGFIISTNLTDWLNGQYAGGTHAGHHVFLRFTPRADPAFYDVTDGYMIISADHTNTANRPVISYDIDPSLVYRTVTATHGPNGTISPTGIVQVLDGGSHSFSLNADPYYHTEEVLVAGTTLSFSSTVTVTNVIADVNLYANFAANRNFKGVPDWWIAESHPEWISNLIVRAVSDFDLDGIPTWQEYHGGTDATNAGSRFMLEIKKTNGTTEVAFDTVPADARDTAAGFHRVYTLEQSDALTTQTWSAVAGMAGIAGLGQRETYAPDTTSAASTAFFRGKVEVVNGSETNSRPPNIILLLTDDMGWGDLHFQGHPYVQTPNLDRLAAEGTVFTQFYVNCSVCSPTRTGFMTGHYPARHGVHSAISGNHDQNVAKGIVDFLDPAATTVTRVLQTNGYAVGHFGKWHLGNVADAPLPKSYGIDKDMTVNSNGPDIEDSAYFDQFDPTFADDYFRNLSTHAIMYEAADFIETHRHQPFYLNLWTLLPHALLTPTPEQLAVYEGLTVNTNDFPFWMRDYLAGAADVDSQMKVWCASITAIDDAVGILLDKLEELGLAGNTLILFTSDNGPEDYEIAKAANAGVGSPGRFRARKRGIYEGGIHVPCIVRWPDKVPVGQVNSNSVFTAVDWFPTIMSLAGIDMPDIAPDGEDMSDVLIGGTRVRTRPIMWEWRYEITKHGEDYDPPALAIRDGDWKLFTENDGTGTELYDLPNDLEERTNLVGLPQYTNLIDNLKTQLLDWKATLP